MGKRLIIILFLLHILTPEGLPHYLNDDNLLRKIVSQYGQARVTIPLPGTMVINELSDNLSISSFDDKTLEIVLSPLTVEWFISRQFDYRILELPDTKSIITSSNLDQAKEWSTYPTYTQYDSIMKSFQALYPTLCRLDTIGQSVFGKNVLVLKISDNVETEEDEPETFYTSTIHGDETGGFILMLRLADYLLKNYNTSSRVKNLVDNLEIWINPLANPDGTYRSGNIISSPVRENANWVDLNRDFPDPDDNTNIKQQETIDMMKFLKAHNFVISANFHAGREVVNYPWDRWSRLHADDEWFYYIGRKYADTAHLFSSPGYMTYKDNGVTNGYAWYQINGGRQDYITWERQGREVTIELDYDYITPASNLNLLWQYNWHSLIGYLENALYGIHGLVKDAITGNPVPAKIFIYGHDKDSSHVYSDTLTGSFVRLLSDKTWDLNFSATGYINRLVRGVEVVKEKGTELIVDMVPITNAVDTARTFSLILYPNPASDYIKVVLPEWQIGIVNVRIYNSTGIKMADYNVQTLDGLALLINVTGYSPGAYSLVITNKDLNIIDKGRFVVVHP